MKRTRLALAIIIIVSICGAFATKPISNSSIHKYRIVAVCSFLIYVEDITSRQMGVEYDCIVDPIGICTFTTDRIPTYDGITGRLYFSYTIFNGFVEEESGIYEGP